MNSLTETGLRASGRRPARSSGDFCERDRLGSALNARQGDDGHCPLPSARGEPKRPAVQLNQRIGDGEAQPGALQAVRQDVASACSNGRPSPQCPRRRCPARCPRRRNRSARRTPAAPISTAPPSGANFTALRISVVRMRSTALRIGLDALGLRRLRRDRHALLPRGRRDVEHRCVDRLSTRKRL